MPSGNGKPNSLVEWVAGHNMPKKKTKSLRPLLSASVDIMTDDVNKKDYVAVGFPHNNSPLRLFDRGQSSSKKVTFNSSALRHSVDALSLLADSSGGEFLSDYDSDDNVVAPSKAVVKPRKSSFKQGKERNFVDTDTSEGETGHADHGMSPHPNCDCILCAAGRSLMRELGKGGPDHANVANAAKKAKASKSVESDVTAGETTTAGETESEPQSKGKGKKGKGGGGQGDSQNQEKKDDGAAKKDNNSSDNNKKDEAKKNENDNKKNNNEKKHDENKKDGDNNNKKGDQGKGDQGKGDQGKQNNKQEVKGNPAAGNTPLPYRGSPNNRIILPVRQQTVHLEHAIEDTAKDHPPNAYMDLNRDVCRLYHGSEWGTHRKPHPSHSCAMLPPTPAQNMASMYPMGPYIHGMPSMPPMYPPQVHPQSAYTQMVYPHHMYQPAYIPAAQQQSINQQTAQAFLHPQMYVPQLHPSYGVYPPHSQPGAAYLQPGAMWGATAQATAPAASFMPAAATATANAGLSGMGLSGMGPSGMGLSGIGLSGMGPSLSGLPNDPGEPPVVQFQPSRSPYTAAEADELLAKQREETRKRYPNGITGSGKAKSPAGSVKAPSKTPTENGANGDAKGNDGGTNGYHWNDKNSNGGDNANNVNNDAANGNNSGEAQTAEEWAASAPDATSWDAPAVASWDTGNDGFDAAAPTRYDASQCKNCENSVRPLANLTTAAGDPDTVNDNPADHMPGSWNAWDTPQSGSQPGSLAGAADSGYVTVDPVPADHDVPTWNETTTSMLSSFGMCCRSTLSAAKQTIFGPSSDDTGVDNGEEQGGWNDPTVGPANGTAQGGWGDFVANEPTGSW